MLPHKPERQAPESLADRATQEPADLPAVAPHIATAVSMPLLMATKFVLPVLGSDHMTRPRLTKRLEQVDRPLTLIVAPQGYGKTTLLSEWAHHSEQRIAWVALDTTDSDPHRFWQYLITALDLAQQGIGSDALSLLNTQSESVEEAVVALINKLAIAEPMILALDSYEHIQTMAVHQTLDFLLDHLPPTLRIVIASRGEPPLALSRQRATDQLAEFGVAELQFTSAEMAMLIHQLVGAELSFEQQALLEHRTEGWVAGIRLVARLLRSSNDAHALLHGFSGAHRDVQDYLEQEVLSQLSGDLQAFMLQTALFDRLCAPLCEAVLGVKESQSMLMVFERSGLFLFPLDAERYWYRYHHLFAEALRYRLYQEAPDLAEALRQRIATCSTTQPLRDDTSDTPAWMQEAILNEQAVGGNRSYNMLLSQRERDVLRLLADGRSNQEIAKTLIIGVNTVKMHIQHLYDKLDVHNRVQAIARAHSLGLV